MLEGYGNMKKYAIRERILRANPIVTQPTTLEISDDEEVIDIQGRRHETLGWSYYILTLRKLPVEHKD